MSLLSALCFSHYSNIVIYFSFPSLVSPLLFFSLYLLLRFFPLIPTPYLFPDIWEFLFYTFWIPRYIFLSYYISNFSWYSKACTIFKNFFFPTYMYYCFYLCCCLFLVFSHFFWNILVYFFLGIHLHGVRFCFIYWFL